MLRLVFGALRRRRAQGLAVLVLTVLLCAVAAAGPLYTAAAGGRVAAADLAEAPAPQRLLSVHRSAPTGGDPATALDGFRREVEALLPGEHGAVLGLTQTLTADTGGFGRMVPVAYRDGACPSMRLAGDCPARAGEAAVSAHTANALGLRAGDELVLRSQPGAPKVSLRVTATYERQDPGGAWWADPLFGPGHIVAGEETLDPVFVPLETFAGDVLDGPTAVCTVPVTKALIDRLDVVSTTLREAGFDTEAPSGALLDRIAEDQAATADGVLAGWVEALTLCLLALGIVGRHTAQDRRPDLALLKLRGATRRRMLRLVLWQHLLPVAAALPAGLPLGWAVARLAAGAPAPADRLPAAAVAAGIAAGAGLVVLVLVEVPLLRTPVAGLLRRSAAPGRRWAGALVDVLLVALAGAALVQARSGTGNGVGLVAPVLAALAVAGLLARVVTALAGQAGRAALRTGRLPLAMAALQYHRRAGIDRIFALVAVAVALLGLAASGYAAAGRARAERTAAELGADRVFTVRAANQSVLLSAVRAADPGGRQAMAVALDRGAVPPVLAVDTARYAAVTGRPLSLPPALDSDPPAVDGDELTVRAVNDSGGPLRLTVQLVHATNGATVRVVLGPLDPGEHEATAPVDGCATAPGCRIVSLALAGPSDVDGAPGPAPAGAGLSVRALRQHARTVLDGGRLGDPRYWRSALSGPVIVIAPKAGALTLRVPRPAFDGDTAVPDARAFAVDTRLPVPALLAGQRPHAWNFGDALLSMFGASAVPLDLTRTGALLPVLGPAGVVLDLATLQRALPDLVNPGELQVWLAPGAPAGAIAGRLAAAGVELLGSETAREHERRLATHGPAFAALFRLLAAAAGLLLAAVASAVAVTVEQRVRAREVRAMRTQGLAARVAVGAGVGGQLALLGLATLGGLVTAVVVGAAVGEPIPVFVDGWRLTQPPPAFQPVALAAAGLLAVLVLGGVSAGVLLSWTRGVLREGAGR
ncbi:FtsX-like permease family protein [Dactylosporangium sucinum]|uniref:ABC3 transporter permease C-terminal domain-containing protein n=1 Tax=Dactylosporangium sucinum TaxID=1424081 RepID=A0A917U5N8_9ACTN|nr:ABC transporter permease [Dactylosporangium sucinum]GGM58992.1 hypothetical protein GCM10007977_070650 [Dactylosporangium sucinum]